jgi:hypothetical protein
MPNLREKKLFIDKHSSLFHPGDSEEWKKFCIIDPKAFLEKNLLQKMFLKFLEKAFSTTLSAVACTIKPFTLVNDITVL